MVVSEFLAALGLKDNFSSPLDKALKKGQQNVNKFKTVAVKSFGLASVAVTAFVTTAATGIYKLTQRLVAADNDLERFAKQLGVPKDAAYATKSALDAMGKTLEEVQADPRLLRQFRDLRDQAEKLKPPDMSEGMDQVRSINSEITKLKQIGSAALQWVGHYFLKHISKPMEQLHVKLQGFNDMISANLPKWADKAGAALSWIVRLGTTLLKGAGHIYTAIGKIFDMIPDNVKKAIGAFGALATFIKMGPVGKLITILSLALLLLDDFFTYLEGGDSLLGGLWQTLLDIWDKLRDSGVFDRLKESAQKALHIISEGLENAKQYLSELYQKFKDSGAIGEFKRLLVGVKDFLGNLIETFGDLAGNIVRAFTGTGKDALDWFISEGLPLLIGFVADVIEKFSKFTGKLNELGLAQPLIIGIASAFGGLKLIDGITGSVQNFTKTLKGVSEAPGRIKSLVSAFSGLKAVLAKTKAVQLAQAAATKIASAATAAWNAVLSANPIALIILAIIALIAIVVLLVKNWDKVSDFFKNLWAKIKAVFSGIGEWFGKKFTQAKEAVMNAFASIGEWFGEKVQAIKDFFLSIPGTAKDAITKTVETIKRIFAPIVDWFKGKIDAVKGFFGGIADGVKGFFGGGSSSSDMAGHAEGGVFDKEHVARFAEGGQAEAVVPLTKPGRAKEVLGQIAQYMGGGGMDSIDKLVSAIQAFTTQTTAILSQHSALAASTSGGGGGVVYNNQKYNMPVSTNVYTSSDKPKDVADAVDRTQQMTIRNLKDVIV